MPDEIEIELDLEPTTPDPKETKIIVDKDGGEGGSNKPVTADDLLDLQKELDAAKADRDRARRGEVAATAKVAEVERDSTAKIASEIDKRIAEQETTLTAALAGAQSEIESCRTLAAKAMEEGKWQEAAEANENLGDAKARLRDLNQQKGYLERAKADAKTQAEAPKAPQLGAKTQSWIAQHPRFNSDPEYRAAALYGHEKAIRAGLVPDTDEYFEAVELVTGDRKAEAKVEDKNTGSGSGEGAGGKSPASGENRRSEAAPVTRRATPNGSGAGGGKQTIKLSGDQVEAADSLFGDPTVPTLYIKDPKERYTYWHNQQERLKTEGRI